MVKKEEHTAVPRVIVDDDGDVWVELRHPGSQYWGTGKFALVAYWELVRQALSDYTEAYIRKTYGVTSKGKVYRAKRIGPAKPSSR